MGFPFGLSSGSRSKTEAILSRRTLTDAQWARIEGHLPGREGLPGRSGTDNRLFVDAVLWLARTASPLARPAARIRQVDRRARALPTMGACRGLGGLFNELSADPDFEYILIDSTICKAHADATRARGGTKAQGIGRSPGGLTTKIHAAVDALGLPVRLIPTEGQHGDCPQAAGLLKGLQDVGHVIADASRSSRR